MASAKSEPVEGRRDLAILGAGEIQSPARGQHKLSLTMTPIATGGTHVIQLVGGEVSRSIATRTDAGMAAGPQPAERREMRATSYNDSIGIELAMRDCRPVYTRMVDGREEIAYKSSEMDEGKIYTVEWNGDHYALRKSGAGVEIFKFRPNDNGD